MYLGLLVLHHNGWSYIVFPGLGSPNVMHFSAILQDGTALVEGPLHVVTGLNISYCCRIKVGWHNYMVSFLPVIKVKGYIVLPSIV